MKVIRSTPGWPRDTQGSRAARETLCNGLSNKYLCTLKAIQTLGNSLLTLALLVVVDGTLLLGAYLAPPRSGDVRISDWRPSRLAVMSAADAPGEGDLQYSTFHLYSTF